MKFMKFDIISYEAALVNAHNKSFSLVNFNVFYIIIILSRVMRKLDFCICKNKDEDQLRGYSEADRRVCFSNIDSTIPLLNEISSL